MRHARGRTIGCIIGTTRRCIGARSQVDEDGRARVPALIVIRLQEQNCFEEKTLRPKKKVFVAFLDKTR